VEIHAPHRPTASVKEGFVHLTLITLGALIAPSFAGVASWREHRALAGPASGHRSSPKGLRDALVIVSSLALGVHLVSGQVQPPAAPILQEPQTILLWPAGAPGALGDDEADKPALTIYMPSNAAGPLTAVIIAPGGSYQRLSMNLEGREPANYFNAMGMAAFVLRYRLGPRYRHPIQLGDAQRAIRMVRARAGEWHVAPDRIGILGFSAGGHLASTASTRFDKGYPDALDPVDRVSSRPDFAVLGYPVISMVESWTHRLSKTNLLGENPDAGLARSLSTDTQVGAATPPTFIYQTNTDTTVPAENAVMYFLALRRAGVAAELHVFREGRHGTGLGLTDPALAQWPALLANWLRGSGFLQ
jgi:acetyl esterase/lipase